MESDVRSASVTLQNLFFGGGFECWYCGMMFVISSAVTLIYVVLVVFSPYKMSTHLSVQQHSFVS